MNITILGIESSCDDTSAAIVRNGILLSNLIANQRVHQQYGGVVPELASRAHQKNIVPVVDQVLNESGIPLDKIDAIAYTRGPGLMGSLLVGSSFAKGLSVALQKPLIEVNHLQAHILAPFIKRIGEELKVPRLPYLCLLISGGHTQLVVVKDHLHMVTIGNTIDDAAGEAFDKCAKIIGFDYPGGPKIDEYAGLGNEHSFRFSKPEVQGLDFSFSGLKTSFLYFIRDQHKKNNNFIRENRNNLCASIQFTIIEILMDKLIKAAQSTGIKEIAIAGGVSANKGIRARIIDESKSRNWNVYIPEFSYTTDNAAMIAQTAFYKFQKKQFSPLDIVPKARYNIGTSDLS